MVDSLEKHMHSSFCHVLNSNRFNLDRMEITVTSELINEVQNCTCYFQGGICQLSSVQEPDVVICQAPNTYLPVSHF
jgi:hypothetical protein